MAWIISIASGALVGAWATWMCGMTGLGISIVAWIIGGAVMFAIVKGEDE